MQKNRLALSFLITAGLIFSLAVGIASAAPVTQSISYQGKLTDAAGNPLTGSYSVTFRLYDVSSGGTALATDTHSVTASGGLFTTALEFDPLLFDGRALWLGIRVGADPEMTPRQTLQPVPYALGLRPGAVGTSLTTNKAGTGYYQTVPGMNISTTYAWNPGIRIDTTADSSSGAWVTTHGRYSSGIYALSYGSLADGVQGYAFGLSGTGVYGESVNGSGVYGKGKEGGHFTTASAGTSFNDLRPGVNVFTAFNYNPGVNVSTSGDGSNGMHASTTGSGSAGLRSSTMGSGSYGVVASTEGADSLGVYASTTGEMSNGVVVSTTGEQSNGVSISTSGINSNGISVSTAGGSSKGVDVTTTGPNSEGLHVYTTGSYTPGVGISTTGYGSQGVVVNSAGDMAESIAVYSAGVGSSGLFASSLQYDGIWAETYREDNKYGLQTPDLIRALGYETGASDVAEYMPVSGDVSPGTVLIIGDDGRLYPSTSAYDTGVAGIVSTGPGIFLGAKEDGNPGERLIAVAGRVLCKVDASHGPIHPRDLLTTSDNPGYAMKATNPQVGTVLGKAMGTLESGTGTIEVLVTLQ